MVGAVPSTAQVALLILATLKLIHIAVKHEDQALILVCASINNAEITIY